MSAALIITRLPRNYATKGDGQRQSARVSKSIAAHSSCRVTRSHYPISCNAHHVSRSRRKLVGCAPMEYCGNQIHLQLSSSRSELQLEAGPKLFPIHSKQRRISITNERIRVNIHQTVASRFRHCSSVDRGARAICDFSMAHQTLLARDLFLNDPSFVMRRICYPHDRFLGRQRRSRLASALVWHTNTCKTVIQARIQSRAFRDTFLDRSFRYAPASSRKRRPYRSRDNYDRHYRIPYSLLCRPHDATLPGANRAISCLG